jgi:hypothetical protein
MITKIPKAWTQAEINEYFNIRINTIEKFMPQLVIGFEDVVSDEDTIKVSTVLRNSTKTEMINLMKEIKTNIQRKS